ncbi:hypothetical protein BZZ01_32755 (plasmid) [Nostocales cyanobacterium HT-58-2]|nr:hypothetical protein BZZ01_32755 [Nostocales cyanobacterium HT-58-2]
MNYCQGQKQAAVRWSFLNKKEQFFVAQSNQLPLNVSTQIKEDVFRFSQRFYKNFPGMELTTYNFTVEAPPFIPKGLKTPPNIYLLSGTWDDHGSIGDYDTGHGYVKSYSGELKVGTGYSISGTATNEVRGGFYVDLLLQWRCEGCEITITSSQSGQKLLVDSGACPVHFHVSCNDNCPSGYIRCETSQYPGYCCVPCHEIKSSLAAATNAIRRLNHG